MIQRFRIGIIVNISNLVIQMRIKILWMMLIISGWMKEVQTSEKDIEMIVTKTMKILKLMVCLKMKIK